VLVPRQLLSELLEDGICPLHLRIQIQRLLATPSALREVAGKTEPRFVPRLAQLRAQRRQQKQAEREEAVPSEEVTPEDAALADENAPGHEDESAPEAPAAADADTDADATAADAATATDAANAADAEVVDAEVADADAANAEETAALLPALDESELISPEEVKEAQKLDQEELLQLQVAQLRDRETFTRLEPPCLVLVVCGLPLPEVLALRAVSSSALQWSMHVAIARLGQVCVAHHRVRTRLWISRLEEINRSTSDESVYDSKVRRLADDALRRRMEAEMADARQDMENRIRDFHLEVDRRMEAQAVRVHAIVEERVQQQLDAILAAEMEKVRVLVEERVQGRVHQVVQREVYATVCEMQAKLATLAKENEKLRTVFLEHLDHSDLCFRSLVWALNPNSTGLFARTLRLIWCCRRRFTRFSAWMLGVPLDRRRDILRARLELMQQAGALRAASAGNESQRIEGRQKLLAALQGAAEAAEAHHRASATVEEVTEDNEDADAHDTPEVSEARVPEGEAPAEAPEVAEEAPIEASGVSEVEAVAEGPATTAPAVAALAARDLQRTAEELVAAALGACRRPEEPQGAPPPLRRSTSNQESDSEAHLTDVPSDEEDMAGLVATEDIYSPYSGAAEAALEFEEESEPDFQDAEEDEEFWDVRMEESMPTPMPEEERGASVSE